MFPQIQLIIGAVILTIVLGLGAALYIQHQEISGLTSQLATEQTKNAVQDATITQLQANAAEVKKLFEDNNARLQQAAQSATEVSKLLALSNTSAAASNPTQVQSTINAGLQTLFQQLVTETDPATLGATIPAVKGAKK
jgi:ABC-type transporter Mla subunit MlaD